MSPEMTSRLELLKRQVIELAEVPALQSVSELLAAGTPPEAVMEALSAGLEEIGRLYELREYYMTALVLSGELLRQAQQILMPHLIKKRSGGEKKGKILIGTIEGDIHDLGKNMASYFLQAYGFEVIDLGVDVAPRVFLAEALKHRPDAVGVSVLLINCVEPLKRLAGLIRETYAGQSDAPLLFAGCGFMRPGRHTLKELHKKSSEWLGVEKVVTEVGETVNLCLDHVNRKNSGCPG